MTVRPMKRGLPPSRLNQISSPKFHKQTASNSSRSERHNLVSSSLEFVFAQIVGRLFLLLQPFEVERHE